MNFIIKTPTDVMKSTEGMDFNEKNSLYCVCVGSCTSDEKSCLSMFEKYIALLIQRAIKHEGMNSSRSASYRYIGMAAGDLIIKKEGVISL